MHRFMPLALLLACSEYKVHTVDDLNGGGGDALPEGSEGDDEGTPADPTLDSGDVWGQICDPSGAVSYTHLRAHET